MRCDISDIGLRKKQLENAHPMSKTRSSPMQVKRIRHIDCSEPNKDGMYDYYYEYDVYYFTEGVMSLSVRSYTDEPEEADFMGIELDGETREIEIADMAHPFFLSAYDYLLAEGKLRFNRFTNNRYDPLPAI